MASLQGYAGLQRRLAAIKGPVLGQPMMRQLGMAVVRESKLIVPRKTGNLGRSIHLGAVGDMSAQVIASASYAAYVELGTRPHEITPNAKKALRWSTGGRRLTGSPTKGAVRAGDVAFATRVHHPGTRPHPYMLPGARKAIVSAGLAERVIAAWNGAD